MANLIQRDETRRIAELSRLRILDTASDAQYDLVGTAAAALFRTPIALISLVDSSRQWFKTAHGLSVRQTSRSDSFCSHAIERPGEVMIIPDALEDTRFARMSLVTGFPNIRFYAGSPLVTSTGYALGTVCVIDSQPRNLTDREAESLRALAALTTRLIELDACGDSTHSLNRLFGRAS